MPSQKYTQLQRELEHQKKKLENRNLHLQALRNSLEHDLADYSSDILRSKQATETQVKLEGLQDYYKMRKGWGDFLKKCLFIILIFNIGLVIFVGLGWFKYTDEWFLRIVLTTNLGDIIGLVYLVVRFLFSNQIESKNTK